MQIIEIELHYEIFWYFISYSSTVITAVGYSSFGGLFNSFMMLTRPRVFSGYISVSPSLWYDQGLIFKKIDSFKKSKSDSLSAFFAIGALENSMVDDMKRFVSLLPKEKLRIKSVMLPKENHDTVFPVALTRGLIYLLEPDKTCVG